MPGSLKLRAQALAMQSRNVILHIGAASQFRPGRSLEAWLCASVALLAAIFPLAQLAISALSDPADSIGWLSIWAHGTLAAQTLQTVGVCIAAAAVAIAASAPQATAVSLFEFRGAWAVELAALAPMLLAPYAAAGAWAGLDLGAWSHGALPMAAQIGFSCAPWSYMALRVAMSRLPPSLGEAAAASGMGRLERIWSVWLPLLSAPLVGAALFAAARAFGDYGTAERNGTRTFGVAFHEIWNGSQSQQVAAAVALAALLPALVAAWAASARARRSSPRQFAGAAGDARWARTRPSGGQLAAIATWAAACVAAGWLVPEWQYINWAIDGKWLGWARSLRVVRDALSTSGAVAAILALAGCACAMLFRPGAKGGLPERLVWLVSVNLFIPPMALALAWLSATADGSWLAGALGSARDGKLPLLLAQSAKLAPFALIPVLDRISRENESLREALRAAGLGTFELWGQVLRMTAPAIVLGSAMVFMEALKELEIAITLQHFGYQSTAIKIHSLARFHLEDAIANWVIISQLLMLPALAVVAFWLSRMRTSGRPT
jgi:iron(III) transport system permease protein